MADEKDLGITNMNGITHEGKSCGINDMNCMEEEIGRTCGINDMNCLGEEDKKVCSLNDMNCRGE